jgi:hypothetical protein
VGADSQLGGRPWLAFALVLGISFVPLLPWVYHTGYGNVTVTHAEDPPMSDTNRVQEWRKRQKDQGKEPVTVWLSREEKRRLEGLAKTWQGCE